MLAKDSDCVADVLRKYLVKAKLPPRYNNDAVGKVYNNYLAYLI